LRVKVGERSERIVARDPPAKDRYGVGEAAPQESTGSKAHHHSRYHGRVTAAFRSPVQSRAIKLRT